LAFQLGKTKDLTKELDDIDTKDMGDTLCGQLKIERRDDITKEGIIFLIDLGKNPSPKLISNLFDQFIPDVQSCLRTDQFFESKHNRFRVVFAGRYLANCKETSSKSLPLTILQLSPFSYKDLRSTAREYLPNATDAVITQISAHIMYLTGGHPGCMASILRMYKKKGQPAPDVFLRRNRTKIQDIIETVVSQVYNDIPDELQDTIKSLGLFRYLSHSILEYLLRQKHIQGYSSKYAFADRLTTNYFLRRDMTTLLYNDNHRILALQLRGQIEHTESVQDTCEKYLSNVNARIPEMWAIECLYQFLQHHSEKIDAQKRRLIIRESFLGEEIRRVLNILATNRDAEGIKRNLESVLQVDYEFKFAVNYYLRHKQYNNEPYKELLKQIDHFFTSKPKNAGEQNV